MYTIGVGGSVLLFVFSRGEVLLDPTEVMEALSNVEGVASENKGYEDLKCKVTKCISQTDTKNNQANMNIQNPSSQSNSAKNINTNPSSGGSNTEYKTKKQRDSSSVKETELGSGESAGSFSCFADSCSVYEGTKAERDKARRSTI